MLWWLHGVQILQERHVLKLSNHSQLLPGKLLHKLLYVNISKLESMKRKWQACSQPGSTVFPVFSFVFRCFLVSTKISFVLCSKTAWRKNWAKQQRACFRKLFPKKNVSILVTKIEETRNSVDWARRNQNSLEELFFHALVQRSWQWNVYRDDVWPIYRENFWPVHTNNHALEIICNPNRTIRRVCFLQHN